MLEIFHNVSEKKKKALRGFLSRRWMACLCLSPLSSGSTGNQSRAAHPAPGREWSREHQGGCQHGLGRQEAPGRVITMRKDRRSHKSQCAVQRAELGPGRLRAWRPGHARGCPGRLWERPRAHVPSRQLSSPPPCTEKSRGSPAPAPLEKRKCRRLASVEGDSMWGVWTTPPSRA